MILLSLHKFSKIIELAELIYGASEYEITNKPEIFLEKMSNYLEDFQMTRRCSVNRLREYINELSEPEKADVIVLMCNRSGG